MPSRKSKAIFAIAFEHMRVLPLSPIVPAEIIGQVGKHFGVPLKMNLTGNLRLSRVFLRAVMSTAMGVREPKSMIQKLHYKMYDFRTLFGICNSVFVILLGFSIYGMAVFLLELPHELAVNLGIAMSILTALVNVIWQSPIIALVIAIVHFRLRQASKELMTDGINSDAAEVGMLW